MPIIQAEEALHAVTVYSVGSGNLKQEDSRQILAEWRRIASHGKSEKRKRTIATFIKEGVALIFRRKKDKGKPNV